MSFEIAVGIKHRYLMFTVYNLTKISLSSIAEGGVIFFLFTSQYLMICNGNFFLQVFCRKKKFFVNDTLDIFSFLYWHQ